MLGVLRSSLCAGVLITIGGCVFLACDNRYVGAVMFSVALLCICFKGYYLFTGKVGFLAESRTGKDFARLAIGLAGNLLATFALGLLIRQVIPSLGETAGALCTAKLGQTFLQTLARGAFCGVLMYLAVSIYRDKATPLGILFCIPTFILAGFEHSIADMFYFGASGLWDVRILSFMAAVILGNSVGALVLPVLRPAGCEK